MDEGAASAITSQDGRTPTGLPNRNPATSTPHAKPKGPPGRKPGASGARGNGAPCPEGPNLRHPTLRQP